jgi:hypothetical protein
MVRARSKTAQKVIINSALHAWCAHGEESYAGWFEGSYGEKPWRNFSIVNSIPGSGTDNNCIERFNRTLKQLKAAPVSFSNFVNNSLPLIFSAVGLKNSGKIDGNKVTKGGRDEVDQMAWMRDNTLSRSELMKARDLLDNGNMYHLVINQDKWVYICNSTRNLSTHSESEEIITRKKAEDFYQLITFNKDLKETDYYATTEDARYNLSRYHIVTAVRWPENDSWKLECTCKIFSRNCCYCKDILPTAHDIGLNLVIFPWV